jgi:CheY-like chemotaxis protein
MRNVKTSLLCIKCKTQFTHQHGVQENPVGYILDVVYPKFEWVNERRALNQQAASKKQEIQEKIEPDLPMEPIEQHIKNYPPQKQPEPQITRKQTKKTPKKYPIPQEDENLKVLLVEKQQIHADLIEKSLHNEETFADITSVNSGRKALKQLRNTFDLILLDSELSDVDSSHILYEIRKWSIQAPVVVLTSDITEKEKFLKNGAIMVLEKSIETYRALPEIVQEIYS